MSKLKENLRVIVIEDEKEVGRGVIEKIYEGLDVAMVKFDDDNYAKVPFELIRVETDITVEENQAIKTVSQEGAKVITKEQFGDAIVVVTSSEEMLGDRVDKVDPSNLMIKTMAIMAVGFNLRDELFRDKEEIEITKEQLEKAIKNNTNPKAISESTGGEMSVSSVFPIAMLSVLVLSKLVDVLFDDAVEND